MFPKANIVSDSVNPTTQEESGLPELDADGIIAFLGVSVDEMWM
jgi:hypothetical protein